MYTRYSVIFNIPFDFFGIIEGVNSNVMQTITVKKEPEDISSTSQHDQGQQIQIQQPQTIAVSVAPNQATHTIVETGSNTSANQPQHIMTHHDNSDGSTSLQIAQVQNLPGTHQLTLSNLNQVQIILQIFPEISVILLFFYS